MIAQIFVAFSEKLNFKTEDELIKSTDISTPDMFTFSWDAPCYTTAI